MRRQSFDFVLPDSLIAQQPTVERQAARLLDISGPQAIDRMISDFPNLLRPGDLLVCNDTRVIAARLAGTKETGGKVEVLLERLLSPDRALVQLRSSKSPAAGGKLLLEGSAQAQVMGRQGPFFELCFDLSGCPAAAGSGAPPVDLLEYLDQYGHVPLPPYIKRDDGQQDRQRYQTVFARHPGAVAAPTAGLHFDPPLLERLKAKGVQQAFVTLHVGAGTFAPMRVDELEEHQMHAEWCRVDQSVIDAIAETRSRNGRVIAVGTTVVRALESAALQSTPDQTGSQAGRLVRPFEGETQIFIYPGYSFQVVDALLTNFHLPQSTLLMLVCAFAGTEKVLQAYRHAVAKSYRFFSYGDAMFLEHTASKGRV